MFFFISKTLRIFLDPVFQIFLLFLVCFVLFGKNKTNRFRKTMIALVLTAAIFNTPIVSGSLLFVLETTVPHSDNAPDKKYSHIVVLSGFTDIEKTDAEALPKFGADVARLLVAVKLLREGVAPKILFSGGNGSLNREFEGEARIVSEFAKRFLRVPAQKIMVENDSRNTCENASYTKEMLAKDTPNPDVLLITSAFHMYRSGLSFKRQGISFRPAPVNFRGQSVAEWASDYASFFPSTAGSNMLRVFMTELVGLAAYKVADCI